MAALTQLFSFLFLCVVFVMFSSNPIVVYVTSASIIKVLPARTNALWKYGNSSWWKQLLTLTSALCYPSCVNAHTTYVLCNQVDPEEVHHGPPRSEGPEWEPGRHPGPVTHDHRVPAPLSGPGFTIFHIFHIDCYFQGCCCCRSGKWLTTDRSWLICCAADREMKRDHVFMTELVKWSNNFLSWVVIIVQGRAFLKLCIITTWRLSVCTVHSLPLLMARSFSRPMKNYY